MVQAPEDKGPLCPVPQPADQEHDEDVQVGNPETATIPAQGDVDVVAKPGRERDVPAGPVVPEGTREKGPAEVAQQVEPQDLRRADRDVGIGREVAVDLEAEEENGKEIVVLGDIALWLAGPALCIFLGKTPVSRVNEIRPDSTVNIIGKIKDVSALYRKVKAGEKITFER